MNAQHLSMSQEWFTPQPVIEAAREVMGGIDLDPASSEEANKRVRATSYYSTVIGGLGQYWRGRVFCNPPGGKDGNRSNLVRFWDKLICEYSFGRTKQAVFVAFTLEAFQTTQTIDRPILDWPFCVPKRRLAFVPGSGQKAKSPTHSNAIVYLGPNKDKFKAVFSQFGKVVIPQ